jgi:hypothetical protein
MSYDAEAQEVRGRVTNPRLRQEPMADDRAEPSDVVDEHDVVDPDAVIIEEAPPEPTTAAPTRPDAIPEAARPGAAADAGGDGDMAGDPERMHERWAAIQSTFVDDPRGSVTAAADLVSEAIAALVASAQERERGLRGEWDREGADTEDLRNALRSYRGLLDRLVTR